MNPKGNQIIKKGFIYVKKNKFSNKIKCVCI